MKRFLLLLFLFVPFSSMQSLYGSDTAHQLQLSVKRLNAWIGYDENASRWRRALLLNQLDTEVAKGDQANPSQLKTVLDRFSSNLPGLEHPVFVDVRINLERHIDQLSRAESLSIPDYLAVAEDKFSAPTIEQVERYREDVLYFLDLFKIQYGRGKDPEEIEFLFEELSLEETIEQITELDLASLMPSAGFSEAAEQARLSARGDVIRPLVAVSEAFNRKIASLQDVYFNSAQSALESFVRVLINATDRDLKGFVDQQIKTLREVYPQLGLPGERTTTATVAALTGALETTLQHGDLICAIRRRHSHPNAIFEIHASLLEGEFGQANTRQQPVDEVILGRQIYGQSWANSRARIEFLDDPHQVAASIHLLGDVTSDTYTRQGPITAYAGSNGVFDGRRNLFANVGGFYATDPYVAVNLNSYFKNVDCRLRVVQKVAQKQFLKDKEQSEGIAAARAEIRVHREFSQQTDQALSEGRERLGGEASKLNQIRGLLPNMYAFTQTNRLIAVAQKHDAIHMGASNPAHPINLPADIRVRVHESMVVNFVDPLIVGRTVSNAEIAESIQQATGVVLEGLVATDDPDDNWTITFPEIQPFQFELEDDRIRIGILGERFTQGDRSIRTPLLIKLSFRFVQYKGGLYLVRDGLVTVDSVDKERLDARGVAFKTFLEKKLNQPAKTPQPPDPLQLEPQEELPGVTDKTQDQIVAAEVGGFRLPANLIPVDQLELPQIAKIARQLQLVELRIVDGWLYTGWKKGRPSYGLRTDLSSISTIDSLDQLKPRKLPEEDKTSAISGDSFGAATGEPTN
jgi:hypothetical protein